MTLEIVLLCSGFFAFGIFIGYQFCKMRWHPKEMIEIASIQSKVLKGEISGEEALEQLEKVRKKIGIE